MRKEKTIKNDDGSSDVVQIGLLSGFILCLVLAFSLAPAVQNSQYSKYSTVQQGEAIAPAIAAGIIAGGATAVGYGIGILTEKSLSEETVKTVKVNQTDPQQAEASIYNQALAQSNTVDSLLPAVDKGTGSLDEVLLSEAKIEIVEKLKENKSLTTVYQSANDRIDEVSSKWQKSLLSYHNAQTQFLCSAKNQQKQIGWELSNSTEKSSFASKGGGVMIFADAFIEYQQISSSYDPVSEIESAESSNSFSTSVFGNLEYDNSDNIVGTDVGISSTCGENSSTFSHKLHNSNNYDVRNLDIYDEGSVIDMDPVNTPTTGSNTPYYIYTQDPTQSGAVNTNIVYNPDKIKRILNKIQSKRNYARTQIGDTSSGFVSQVYDEYQAGNIDTEDLLSPYDLHRQKVDEGVSKDAWSRLQLQALDLNSSQYEAGEITLETADGKQVSGQIYTRESGKISENDTISTQQYPLFVRTDSGFKGYTGEDGNLTVRDIQGTDGQQLDNITLSDLGLADANATEVDKVLEQYKIQQEELVKALDSGSAGGGLPFGSSSSILVILAILLLAGYAYTQSNSGGRRRGR